MKDIFYTLLVVWLLWRIVSSVNSHRAKRAGQQQTASKHARPAGGREGETTVNYVPPKKKNVGDDEGEYVEFEDIK